MKTSLRALTTILLILFANCLAMGQGYYWSNFVGQAGTSGSENGAGSVARFNYPYSVAVDGNGNTFVADNQNYIIRKITPSGVVTTFAGTAGLAGHADGTGGAARFYRPAGIAAGPTGNVYVCDNDSLIRKITAAGVVTTLAGATSPGVADGTGSAARFDFTFGGGLAVDATGIVYVADTDNHTIRKVTPGGVVTTLAGSPRSYGYSDGAGTAARFDRPRGVAVDSSGNVYVADTGNSRIRKITSSGVVTTIPGFYVARSVALDGNGNLYLPDSNSSTVVRILGSGAVTTIGGTPYVTGDTDGIGSAAAFSHPTGIAVASDGTIYVADQSNHRISKGVVVDTTATTITNVPANLTPEAASASGAVVTFPMATATDAVGVTSLTVSQVSGSLFPLGVTTVTFTASDAAGNTSTASFTVTVRDATPPYLEYIGAIPLRIAGDSVLADYTGDMLATDAVGVTGITQSPAPGAALTVGPLAIVLTAADAAGNTTSVTVNATVLATSPTVSTFIAKGAAVTGAGVSGSGIPAGAVWVDFGVPSGVVDSQSIGVLGNYKVGAVTKRAVLLHRVETAGFQALASVGDGVVGMDGIAMAGVTFKAFKEPLFHSDGAFLLATIQGPGVTPGNDTGLWWASIDGTQLMIAREGDVASGTGGAVYKAITAIGGDSNAYLTATLVQNGATVTATNDSGLWYIDLDRLPLFEGDDHDPVPLMWREGSPLNAYNQENGGTVALPIKSLRTLYAVAGSPGAGRAGYAPSALATLPNGRLQVVGFEERTSFFRPLGGREGLETISEGIVHRSVGGGEAANLATLKVGVGGATTANNTAVFYSNWPTPIARKGDNAGEPGVTFSAFKDPLADRDQEGFSVIGYTATVKGTGVTTANNTGIWLHRDYSDVTVPHLIARKGSEAPGGGVFSSFPSLAMRSYGGPIFTATLAPSATVTTANNSGLWGHDSLGILRKLLRKGDDLGGGRIVSGFTVLSSVVGSGATTRAFTLAPDGRLDVLMLVTLKNGGKEILRIAVP